MAEPYYKKTYAGKKAKNTANSPKAKPSKSQKASASKKKAKMDKLHPVDRAMIKTTAVLTGRGNSVNKSAYQGHVGQTGSYTTKPGGRILRNPSAIVTTKEGKRRRRGGTDK